MHNALASILAEHPAWIEQFEIARGGFPGPQAMVRTIHLLQQALTRMNVLFFWAPSVFVVWVYVLYPLLVIWLAHRQAPKASAKVADTQPPATAMTVVIAAHNEAERVGKRIVDVLAQQYPADLLQVLVVSDGSEDGTADIARTVAIGNPQVRVLESNSNRGKASALNLAMALVTTPLVAFTDVRQTFAPGALRALAAAFDDPEVGGVSGELVFAADPGHDDTHSGNIGLYWRLELALRAAEAKLGWLHGVSGSIHAIRRELFRPLAEGTILDDVAIPFDVLRAGMRVELTRDARAVDKPSDNVAEEFRRKLRTLAGNWQLISLYPDLMSPRRNPAFFAWLSHKFFRLIVPWALLVILFASAFLSGPFYRLVFFIQLAAYLLAALALLRPRLVGRLPLASSLGTFVLLNTAALLSLPAWLVGDPRRLWKRH